MQIFQVAESIFSKRLGPQAQSLPPNSSRLILTKAACFAQLEDILLS